MPIGTSRCASTTRSFSAVRGVTGFITDFARLNRRMHNKSFTVDNQISIVGGRNIGDEYFAAGSGVVFADLDVAAAGSAVRDVSKQFDLYWNSPSAYPATALVAPAGPDAAARLTEQFAATRADTEAIEYVEAVRTTPIVRDILERRLAFEWATARLVHDDPAKTLDTEGRVDLLLFPELVRMVGAPVKSLDLVSPYFVPGDGGTHALVAMAGRGVRVRILTNSLAASDVAVVHSGYAKRRHALLKAGVQLFELKPNAVQETGDDRMRLRVQFVVRTARQDIRCRQRAGFRRLVQFRPAIRAPEHRTGPADRQRIAGPIARGRLRFHHSAGGLGGAPGVRMAPASSGSSGARPERSGTPRSQAPARLRRLGVDVMSILPIEWLL